MNGATAQDNLSAESLPSQDERSAARPARRAITFGAMAICLFCLARWFYYINAYSVNLLYWDQWDFYVPLFTNASLWDGFFWQHGPHRQGVGFLVIKLVVELSGWNTRAECFVIGGMFVAAAAFAWLLKLRLKLRATPQDIAIPLAFLTLAQWEQFAMTPNPAHGPMPLLLIMLYCLAWTFSNPSLRHASVWLLNFLLIYTGFGLFIGLITPALYVLDGVLAYKRNERRAAAIALAGLLVSLASIGSFFVNYVFAPAASDFRLADPFIRGYILFVSIALSNFWGLKTLSPSTCAVGLFTFFLMVSVLAFHTVILMLGKSKIDKTRSRVIAILITFTLIFLVNSSVGRISLGFSAGQSSRYITYMIPGIFGLYLAMSAMRRSWPGWAIAILLVAATIPVRKDDLLGMTKTKEYKQRWVADYALNGSIESANDFAGQDVHPQSHETYLPAKLDFMKERRLNFFQDIIP